jgi:WD40 repeat protein
VTTVEAVAEPRDCPYVGLDYYQEKFGAWFFGREADGNKIITNMQAARLTLLHAESGVGKSSLLRAGVAWRLRQLVPPESPFRGVVDIPVVFSSWKDDPTTELIGAIGTAIEPFLSGRPLPSLPGQLDTAIEAAADAANASLLVILDQFEEYFVYCAREPTPERFADELARCINRADLPANFLIAIREDAYAGLGDLFKGRIANVYGNYLHIEYLDRAAAETAIRAPLEVYNGLPGVAEEIGIQDELVQAVLDQVRAYDVGTEEIEGVAATVNGGARVATPLLQLVMETVWQRERKEGSRELRLSTLQSLEGVEKIVDTHLGNALRALGGDERQAAIDMFDHLVTPSGGKIAESVPDLARRTGHSEKQVGRVLEKLDRARIVRPVPAPPGQDPMRFRRYEIFHDVLAPAINHTIAAREEERRARHLRRLTALAVGLLIVTLAVVGVFVYLWHSATVAKQTAESRALAADAYVNAAHDPELSALLAQQALRLPYTSQAEAALRAALPQLQEMRALQIGTTVTSAVFDPADENKVASADRYGIAWIWDVKTGHRLVRMSLGGFKATGGAQSVAFNPSGTEVAVAYADGRVAVFDASSGRVQKSVKLGVQLSDAEFLGRTGVLAIATRQGVELWRPRDGKKLHLSTKLATTIAADPSYGFEFAVTTAKGVVIWKITSSGLQRHRLPNGQWFANAAAFNSHGNQIATADSDGNVRVYNVATRKLLMTLGAGEADATSVAFSPAGKKLIVAGYSSGMARVFDPATRLQLTQLVGSGGLIEASRFSARGNEVVTASDDGTLRVWHASPIELRADFPSLSSGGAPSPVFAAQYMPDGRIVSLEESGHLRVFNAQGKLQSNINPPGTLVDSAAWNHASTEIVTVNSDRTVDVWHADGAKFTQVPLSSPIHLTATASDLGISPDGSRITIVTTGDYYTIQVRSARSGRLLQSLHAANSVSGVTFSPNGQQILAGDYNGQVEVWSAASGKRIRILGKRGPGINNLVFNNSGSKFVTASASGVITVWSARDHRPALPPINACSSPTMASFNANGSEIVVACGNGTAPVFSAVTGQQLTVVPAANVGPIGSAGFSPDGKSIIIAIDAKGTGGMQIWNTELANASAHALQRIAAQRITGSLTPAERQTYLAGTG